MVIKKVGGPAVPPPTATESTAATQATDFGAAIGSTSTEAPPAAPTSGMEQSPEVHDAVAAVAERIQSGQLKDPQARVDAVIERIVEVQLGEGASRQLVRARATEVQLALGDHPAFASQVTKMLEAALQSA